MRRQAIIYWDTTIKLIAAYFQTRDLKGWKLEGGPSAAMLQHGGGNICASSDEHSCGGSDDITVIDIRRDVFLVVSFLACDTCTTEIAIRRDQSVKETRVHQTAF
ncbi:hypothetical protein GEV33_015262 [Tenebrio molitor]|uniref:Uncharacterized protein n=1 Tax=Tenebrio molitor TaxID=7067 RepID=A0A8J6H5B9_TENMO|nr:hypothetical protein GEV33_015264 [Tenebrio molitor]KAH0807529.1 hypothetical protein GEV33_015262 [Tenebrio molitor]